MKWTVNGIDMILHLVKVSMILLQLLQEYLRKQRLLPLLYLVETALTVVDLLENLVTVNIADL